MKKVVLKLDVLDDRIKQKAMKNVSSLPGVESIAMEMKDKKLTVTGDVDPVTVVAKLRKICYTEIVSVGPAKEEKKKDDPADKKKAEEEKKKAEEKKKEEERKKKEEEALKAAGYIYPYPCYTSYQQPYNSYPYNHPPIPYKVVQDDSPNSCVIC